MLNKKKVIETINNLPDNFSIDELLERLLLIQKIEVGVAQSKAGKVTDDDDLDDKLKKWLD